MLVFDILYEDKWLGKVPEKYMGLYIDLMIEHGELPSRDSENFTHIEQRLA